MPDIRVLPVHLVNKIAAGEVIERPASVVKELVENAIDADASCVEVTIEDGGKKSISVSDDGAGMDAENLALAFQPHATSKLDTEEDLFNIHTMGFRGEALASIASISHAHIRSQQRGAGDSSGYEVEASGESVGEAKPCPASPGTTITIRDLFFNTPARRKFMRAANTEYGHISEQITRLAIPNPQVAFRLYHNGREVLNLPAVDSTAQRVTDLAGNELSASLIPLTQRNGSVKVAGLAGAPSASRASGKWQYFFINGRFVRDRVLSHALKEAYRGLMAPNRWPVAYIFIDMDPAEVDVNVHPTKIEVRFQESQAVHGEVLATLRETLNKSNITPDISLETPQPTQNSPDQNRQSVRQAIADFFKSSPPPQPQFDFPKPTSSGGNYQPSKTPAPGFAQPGYKPETAPATLEEGIPTAQPSSIASLQIHDSYIVAPTDEGLVIIDQHALHERIIFNDLTRKLTDGPLESQRMLIPEPFEVTTAEVDALENQSELLARLGIEIAPFGPNTVALQQFPVLLAQRKVSAREFLRELLDRITEDDTANPQQLLENILETMACKAAVKAGDKLTSEEIEALITRRDEQEKITSCPHGRPTTIKLTLKELEKQFKRT